MMIVSRCAEMGSTDRALAVAVALRSVLRRPLEPKAVVGHLMSQALDRCHQSVFEAVGRRGLTAADALASWANWPTGKFVVCGIAVLKTV